jgi:phosphatidylserine/phosphatidylglycerophosphate/cardiolipin synthase-like enzyme
VDKIPNAIIKYGEFHPNRPMSKPLPFSPRFPFIACLISCLIVLSGCAHHISPAKSPGSEDASTSTTQSNLFADGAIQVWFTDPEGIRGSPKPLDALLGAVNSAQKSLDIAIYNFSEPALANALIHAKNRGVQVRLVMESDNLTKPVPQWLLTAGIPIIGDGQDSLMHDKFMVVDGKTLLVGSANFTDNGLNTDNNYLLQINDPNLAEAYSEEFESMFVNGNFGATDLQSSPRTDFKPGGIPLEVYFSPEDGISHHLLDLVGQAEKSVYFLAYTFTLDNLGQELVDKHQSGLDVRGVFEGDMLPGSTGTEFDLLRRAGMDIRLDGNPNLMHEKLLVIDGEAVVIGSYNFTRAADERNDENILIIHDPRLVSLFEGQFWEIFDNSH